MQPSSFRSTIAREPFLVAILSTVHLAVALVMGVVASQYLVNNQIGFPKDVAFLSVGLGQLTLAATWCAYGGGRLVLRGLLACLLVVVGGYMVVVGFHLGGGAADVFFALILFGAEWFLCLAAMLLAARLLLGRRIVALAELKSGRQGGSQFSLRQLFVIAAIFAVPLSAPGLFSSDTTANAAIMLCCVVIAPLVLAIAAPVGWALLARERPGRKLLIALVATLVISALECLALIGSQIWAVIGAQVYYVVLVSVFGFNGGIAAVAAGTLIVLRIAGYRLTGNRFGARRPRSDMAGGDDECRFPDVPMRSAA